LAGGLPFEAKAVSNTFKDFAGAMPETDDPKSIAKLPNLAFQR
jgi:hypothetical protein